MKSMLNQILRWMRQPKIWRLVSFVSSIVGFLCYALSSSFNHLFGNWNFLKISLYTVFSFIVSFTVLFANTWQNSNSSLRLKAHLVFSVFTITTVYSFFYDKANGKPDVYILVSDAAFAIMSLGLSKQTQFGFEVDLLYFFCGFLILQFMKMKLVLVLAGASFSYLLIILRFYLNAEYSEELINTADYHAIQIDHVSQVNSDNVVPSMTFDALPENMDLGLQQDSLALVNQINLSSQHDNIRDNDHYKKLLARTNLNCMNSEEVKLISQEASLDSNVWPPSTFGITWMADFIKNKLRKIVDKDGFSTELPGVWVRILKSNYQDSKISIFTINNRRTNFLNLMDLIIPNGIRHRRGSKLRSQQLKEMADAVEKSDDGQDDYQQRLLEYHYYL